MYADFERNVVARRKTFGTFPLYFLLFTDVANGLWSLAFPDAGFTLIALGIKAVIAIYIASLCEWTYRSLILISTTVAFVCWILLLVAGDGESVALVLKVGSVVALFVLLDRYCCNISSDDIARFLLSALMLIAFSLLFGMLGLGHERYGENDGVGLQYNGFLIAGNEINIALVGLFWWLSSLRRRVGASVYSVFFWLCLALMILSQSKTTILGAIITMLYFQRLRPASVVVLLATVPLLIYLFLQSSIWDRWVFFYQAFADEGVLSAMTGGRFGRVANFDFTVTDLFLGGIAVLASTGGYIESDPLDMVFNFGLAGLLLYGMFALKLFDVCNRLLIPWALIIFASVFAGHVAYSVFAAPIIFCAFRYSLARRRKGFVMSPVRARVPADGPQALEVR